MNAPSVINLLQPKEKEWKAMGNEEKRQRVYEAALQLFSRYGFKKTTVEDIAGALGMTQGNLYRPRGNPITTGTGDRL